MIVEFMPSPLHQCISEAFLTAIHRGTDDLPSAIGSTITTSSNEDFNDFTGKYENSVKVPDAGVFLDDINGDMQIKIAMEVGFAETYQDLVQDVRKWLEGAGAVLAILVKVEETPVFQNPSLSMDGDEKEHLFSQSPGVRARDFRIDGDFGPALYKALQWVGRISSVELETWTRDPSTGLASKNPDTIVSYHSSMKQAQVANSSMIEPSYS